jgi:hypothetical protein
LVWIPEEIILNEKGTRVVLLFRKLLTVIIATSASLLIAEFTLRATNFIKKMYPDASVGIDSYVQYEAKKNLHYSLIPGFSGIVDDPFEANKKIQYSINSIGMRGAEPKKEVTNRVVVVGDSATFGLGVNDDETAPYVLQTLLNKLDEETWQVYNCSVPGYHLEQEFNYCSEFIKGIKPNHVLLSITMNDVYHTHYFALGQLINQFSQQFPSHLLFLVNMLVSSNKMPEMVGVDGFKLQLLKFKALADQTDSELTAFIFPLATDIGSLDTVRPISVQPSLLIREAMVKELSIQEIQSLQKFYIGAAGIEYLDLFRPFSGYVEGDFLIRAGDHHYNPKGHTELAKILAAHLTGG